jgi:hypothetical protein
MLVVAWILVAVLVVAAVGELLAVSWERRRPSSFSRRDPLAWWAEMPAEEQEAYDLAVLDRAEQAELDARADARDSAAHLVHRVQINAQFHP